MSSNADYLNHYARFHERDVKSLCMECWSHVVPGEMCTCNPPKSFEDIQDIFENKHVPNIMKQDKEYTDRKTESPTKDNLDWSKCTPDNAVKEYGVSEALVLFFKNNMNDTWYQANKDEWDKHKDVLSDNPWMMFINTKFREKYNAVPQGQRKNVLDFIFRRVLDEKVPENCAEFLTTGTFH